MATLKSQTDGHILILLGYHNHPFFTKTKIGHIKISFKHMGTVFDDIVVMAAYLLVKSISKIKVKY